MWVDSKHEIVIFITIESEVIDDCARCDAIQTIDKRNGIDSDISNVTVDVSGCACLFVCVSVYR